MQSIPSFLSPIQGGHEKGPKALFHFLRPGANSAVCTWPLLSQQRPQFQHSRFPGPLHRKHNGFSVNVDKIHAMPAVSGTAPRLLPEALFPLDWHWYVGHTN